MALLLVTELMFFSGLISAFIVNKAGWDWPPIGQPRLPVEATAINTLVLLGSAVTLYIVARRLSGMKPGYAPKSVHQWLLVTMLLGLFFVCFQGVEWIRLLSFGLTSTSSLYGAFFYTIIGAHALHVVAGLAILMYLRSYLKKAKSLEDKKSTLRTCSIYWYFVVAIWPILYALVYLS